MMVSLAMGSFNFRLIANFIATRGVVQKWFNAFIIQLTLNDQM